MASLALFATGVYVSIRLLAALYRVADLWYRIGTDGPRVAGEIAGWSAAALAPALLADGGRRAAFLCGLVGYALFHVLVYAASRAYVRTRVRSRRGGS